MTLFLHQYRLVQKNSLLAIASQEDGGISQGSVTTSLRYVGIISDEFTTNARGESKILKFN